MEYNSNQSVASALGEEWNRTMVGTTVKAEVVRVVDGDTVRVRVGSDETSLRLLAIDTEESRPGKKPQTPWGKAAKEFAKTIFNPGDPVTLEFPGKEPAEVAWKKYRGSFSRPLVYIYDVHGRDYQEMMIRQGYSPYFMKYGYAHFHTHHQRYMKAERDAQEAHVGVWDQMTVNNGTEFRNYAALGIWWDLRARVIQVYRDFKAANPGAPVFNTRIDYKEVRQRAEQRAHGTVFTELRYLRRVRGDHGIISIGSIDLPFNVFLRELDEPPGQQIVTLLHNRYLSSDSTHLRRNYACVTGQMQIFGDVPQIVVTKVDQIFDAEDLQHRLGTGG